MNTQTTQTQATETQVADVRSQYWMETFGSMITRVEPNGKNLYVVVADIAKFKADSLAQCTKRENKNRKEEGRFEWLLKTYLRAFYDMKGKAMKVNLLQGEANGPFTNEAGEVIMIDLNNLPAPAVKEEKPKTEGKKRGRKPKEAKAENAPAEEAKVESAEDVAQQDAQPEVPAAPQVPLAKNGKPITGAALRSWKIKNGLEVK